MTPFHSPVRVKRRFTPPKPASALRMRSSATPSSCATAIAAVALSALCRPGIGSASSSISCAVVAGAVAEHDREARRAVGMIEIDEPHVGLRILAVGDDAAILDAADQLLHDRMIGAHHREAVERHVLDESAETPSCTASKVLK